MRLTSVLSLGHQLWPKGNVWRGKNRLVPPYGKGAKASALKRLLWEYENMRILAKPYLTTEEEAIQPDWTAEQEKLQEHIVDRSDMKKFQHIFTEDLLSHLNVTKRWF